MACHRGETRVSRAVDAKRKTLLMLLRTLRHFGQLPEFLLRKTNTRQSTGMNPYNTSQFMTALPRAIVNFGSPRSTRLPM